MFIKRLLVEPKDRPFYYRVSSQAIPFAVLYKEITSLARKLVSFSYKSDDEDECVVHFYTTCLNIILKEIVRREDISRENLQNMSRRLFQLIPSMLHQWSHYKQAECLDDLEVSHDNLDQVLA